MALQRVSPQDFSPNGTNIYQGFKNDDEDIKNLYKLMNSTGVLSLAGSKRQCVLYGSVDSSGNPNFLTASGLNISIDGSTKPVILSFANGFDTTLGTKDILMSITSDISNAWTIPASGTYYLYIDRDINTGLLSYGYTTTPDDYLKVAPASPVLDQNYFNTVEMKMYRYNGSAWEQKLRIFVGKVVTTTSAATVTPYNLLSKASNSGVPTGSIEMWAGINTDIPDGWLECNGAAISRTVYSELFAIVGTKWGVGDGSTTFNLPSFLQRMPLGADYTPNSNNTSGYNLVAGQTGGEWTHTLSINEMPSHSHSTDTQGSHAHTVTMYRTNKAGTTTWTVWSFSENNCGTGRFTTDVGGAHGHNITSTGGGTAHNNMPPYSTVVFIIKY